MGKVRKFFTVFLLCLPVSIGYLAVAQYVDTEKIDFATLFFDPRHLIIAFSVALVILVWDMVKNRTTEERTRD